MSALWSVSNHESCQREILVKTKKLNPKSLHYFICILISRVVIKHSTILRTKYLLSLFFFFPFFYTNEKKVKGGSSPFLIQMEEKMRDQLGKFLITRLEVAHLTNKCVQTLALLEILLAFQLWKDNKKKLISKIMKAKFQFFKRSGFWKAKMMLIAFPSRIREYTSKEATDWIGKRAADPNIYLVLEEK